MSFYEKYGAKKNREQFIKELDPDKLRAWGEQKSRDIMYLYNCDMMNDKHITRLNHNTQVRDIITTPITKRHRRAE